MHSKLIIGSRLTGEIQGGHPKERSEFENLSKIEIHAKDVTEEMIKRFLERKYGLSDERIERVSKNLEEYKKDLWHLSWALKSYNPQKDSVEEKEIYEKIRDSIRKIKLGQDELGKDKYLNAEDVFLPLSIFYRFEIPVERKFLGEQMRVEENIINQLIDLSEIIETEERGKRRTLSLNHSSIADLYFKTYQNYPDLGENIKEIFQENDSYIEYLLFYQYISSTPRNSLDISIHLGRVWFEEKGGTKLLKKLIEGKEIKKSFKEDIEKEDDIKKIGFGVIFIAHASSEVALKLANRIDVDILLSKIEKEEDIINIGVCVRGIAVASKEVGLELANRIDIDILSSKIEKEEDIVKIVSCVGDIAWVSKEAGLKLVDSVSSKIEKEEDIEEIGLWVADIAKESEEVALKLVDSVSSKIEIEEDIEKIGRCVGDITWTSEEVAQEIVNCINIDALLSKIEKEEDVRKIGWCVLEIACASEEVAQEIVNRLNPRLKEELNKKGWLK